MLHFLFLFQTQLKLNSKSMLYMTDLPHWRVPGEENNEPPYTRKLVHMSFPLWHLKNIFHRCLWYVSLWPHLVVILVIHIRYDYTDALLSRLITWLSKYFSHFKTSWGVTSPPAVRKCFITLQLIWWDVCDCVPADVPIHVCINWVWLHFVYQVKERRLKILRKNYSGLWLLTFVLNCIGCHIFFHLWWWFCCCSNHWKNKTKTKQITTKTSHFCNCADWC